MTEYVCDNPECINQIEELRARLEEAEETLRAIRSGEVDALVIAGPEGNQIYTLKGAESTYRVLVEAMNEGALVLTSDGIVMYSNSAFADMVDLPLERVIGARIHRFVCDSDLEKVDGLLVEGRQKHAKGELALKNESEDKAIPAQVSVGRLPTDTDSMSAVVTDLTEHKRTEAELEQYREHLEELVAERTEALQATTEELEASNDQLLQEIEDRKHTEQELAQAKDLLQHQVHLLQRALIPAKPPVIEGYPVASAYIPAHAGTDIGGDFLDVFRTEVGKVGILIGDVSGKGIESAALAAITRSTIRAFVYDSSSPGDALSHANSVLSAQQVDYMQFVTSFLVVLDPVTGEISYSSAGHPPAVVSSENGDMEFLCTPNMPLGVICDIKYVEDYHTLNPGDRLVLYTDGVTEARHDRNLFGTEGIVHILTSLNRVNPDVLVEGILVAVREWAYGDLRDDTAILIIQREV